MPYYSVISECRGSFHVTQWTAATPQHALSEHVKSLPYDDGSGPHDDELRWLQSVGSGAGAITLHSVGKTGTMWLWMEGARHEPQYITYVVETVARAPSPAG
jgi:hypothetical protein